MYAETKNSQVSIETGFTPLEIYYLCGAIKGVRDVFGLPARDVLSMEDKGYLQQGKNGLIKKGVLTEDGHLTLAAGALITALTAYTRAEKYVLFNDMIVVPNKEHESVIVLFKDTAYKDGENYRIDVLEKQVLASMLMQNYPVFEKQPDEWDRNNLTEILSLEDSIDMSMVSLQERKALRVRLIKNGPLANLPGGVEEDNTYFLDYGRIIQIDTKNTVCRRVGEYYFYKLIFDLIGIKYGFRTEAQ